MELLWSRSRSQQRFKMWVNVCPDDIFWITEHFVTKFGMVMQHHEPECHAGKKIAFHLQGQGHSEGSYDQNMTLSTIFSVLSIPWQPDLMIHHQKPVSCEKKWITAFRVKITAKGKVVQIISSNPPSILFPNYCDASLCKSSYNQNMTISIDSFELLILLLPNLVW